MGDKARASKRVTQADVARKAGVSQPMVSYVLNDRGAIAVPPETRQRILDAMRELNYVPDRMARSLRTRKSFAIATIIPDITNPFYPAFQRGIQDVADQLGYDLMMYNTDGDAAKERKTLLAVQHGPVDGVIAAFFHLRVTDLRGMLERGQPIVRLEARPQEEGELPLDSLFVDNAAAADAAVQFLIERGHRRIGLIAGHSGPREARFRGYQQALAAHAIPFDPTLVASTNFTGQGGYAAMRALLERVPRPTAIFAANDLMALGAVRAIQEAGLRVPADVAVMGFDDIPAAQLISPQLTTVTQFQEQLGRRAAELLIERLNGSAPEHGRSIEMPFALMVRESV